VAHLLLSNMIAAIIQLNWLIVWSLNSCYRLLVRRL
jgi:hypothetical protein